MDRIFFIISQSRTEIIYLIIIIFILFLLFLWRLRSKRYKIRYNDTMPPNLWFYSELVNLETGAKKANHKNLLDIFIKFLYRKYGSQGFSTQDSNPHHKKGKKKSIFDIVKESETNPEIIDLYGEIWNSIDELKQSPPSEVILYVKSVKLIFNKGNFDEWIEAQKASKPCNDC